MIPTPPLIEIQHPAPLKNGNLGVKDDHWTNPLESFLKAESARQHPPHTAGADQGSNVPSETWVPALRPEFEDNRTGPDPSDRSQCDYISGLAR